MMAGAHAADLFNGDGTLNDGAVGSDALDALRACEVWLRSVRRGTFLPIDLLVVLLSRGHDDLERLVASARTGDDEPLTQLKELARKVERDDSGEARLHVDHFSLGFTGLLHDALQWARETGRGRLSEADLVRVLRWRAELQESASVRWALKQLSQIGGEFLFESDGDLRRWAFTVGMWSVLQDAARLSAQCGLGFLGTPHLMAAAVDFGGLLAEACDIGSVKRRRLRDDLLAIVGDRQPVQPDFALTRQTLTPRLVRMLAASGRSAEARGTPVTEGDILTAFLTDGGSSLDLVTSLGMTETIRKVIAAAQRRGPERGERRVAVFDAPRPSGRHASGGTGTPTLDELGRDLTADARAGRLAPVLGRDPELQLVINVLMRSEQRNPLLTGSAGVGKTALANALAQRIADGKVPERLEGMRVVEINGAALVGGTSYRGELEARIQALLSECELGVILFIDEAHAVFAPRSSSGQPAEVPNHFKAALASGRIAVIAATTEAEFRRWLEEDPALRRRFERIVVEELSPELTRDILASLAPRFEREYHVPITPDAVDAAIELSVRFLPEQSLPDKAKKLLMDATISVASDVALVRAGMIAAPVPEEHATPSKRVVTRLDVARQVAQRSGVPIERVSRGSISWWVGLEGRLLRHVPGQERAVREVAHRLVAGRLTNGARKRPQAVVLLTGPPGVGMAELARGLSIEVFGSTQTLLRLDMSDFSEAHSVSRLVGSPPGYVGYQDEDALVTPMRRTPSRVVLLQDFGQAHPRVQERLLRMFEEGEIADTRGLKADVSHAIFVMTVEIEPQSAQGIGFGTAAAVTGSDVLRRADAGLAARVRGREIDVVVLDGIRETGGALGETLARKRLAEFRASLLAEYGIDLELDAGAEQEFVQRARALDDARALEAVFREVVITPVTKQILEGAPRGRIAVGSGPERGALATDARGFPPAASVTRPPPGVTEESTSAPEPEPA